MSHKSSIRHTAKLLWWKGQLQARTRYFRKFCPRVLFQCIWWCWYHDQNFLLRD